MKYRRWYKITGGLAALALALGALAGCGGDDKSDGGDDGGGTSAQGDAIDIGASLPMTGALERFGVLSKLGYETAVKTVNDAGGLEIDGTRHKINLVILDDESDAQKASENTNKLILQSSVTALLGSITPPQNIPVAQVADAKGVPLVVTGTPIRSFIGAAPEGGWNSSYVMFFDELEQTKLQFQTMDLVESNKKVALFTDQEQDGIVMGGLWEDAAPTMGYEIAYHAEFPVGTTDYGDFIRRAQESGADVLIAQMIPPDAIALWKQMKSLDWKPKAAFIEKSGNSAAWWQALGTEAVGSMATGWWAPELGYPDADLAQEAFASEAMGNVEIGQSADAYTIAMVLMDAIKAAGSTDPEKINEALAATDGDYMSGHIAFDADKAAALDIVALQWQEDGSTAVVWPAEKATAEMIYPLPPW